MNYNTMDMRIFPLWVREYKKLLREVLALCRVKGVQVYLVGGIVRDILVGRKKENPDIDFCLPNGAIAFARALAKKIHAGFVILDAAHGCARVVIKCRRNTVTMDFTDFRGSTLDDDLKLRDFTVNSMAVALTEGFVKKEKDALRIVDPSRGMRDLRGKWVRVVNVRAFDDDPLRILRAFSLAALFGMRISPTTLALAERKRNALKKVSPERIRDEFVKLFSCPNSSQWLSVLSSRKILEVVMPEIRAMRRVEGGPYHHLDVFAHTMETCRQLDLVLEKAARTPALKEYLQEEISSGRKRYEIIKLAGLLHDIGKPKTLRIRKGKISFHGHEHVGALMAQSIAQRLKFSNEEVRAVGAMILAHLRPGFLSDVRPVSARAKFRFFRDTSSWAIGVLLISLADQRATRGRLATPQSRLRHETLVRALLKEGVRARKEKKPKRLLNGDELMKEFSLVSSPLVGKILKALDEQQGIGRIKTRKEALREAKKLLKNA